MLKSNPRSPGMKSFFKKPTGILSAIVLVLVVLSIVNYLISSRTETEFPYLSLDDNTLTITSVQRRGDFWNFAKDKNSKVSNYAPESRTFYILRRNGSIWELEQEISEDKPVAGVNLNDFYVNIQLQGDTLLLQDLSTIYILIRRNGSTWELEQEILLENLL